MGTIPTISSRCRAPRASDTRRALGTVGETLAAEHLSRLGYEILARNVRSRHGEIDLIAFDGSTLAFVEVKTRRGGGRGGTQPPALSPLSCLGRRQRMRLRTLAVAWLSERGSERPPARELRFDAIGVTLDPRDRLLSLDHLEGAW